MIIIGLTGKAGAGKDTVADYLKRKNFKYYSLSDILRQECEVRGIEKNRDNLIMIGNELRNKYGPSILARKIVEKIEEQKVNQAVIVSIRNPKEVEEFQKKKKFILIDIQAPIEIRYERIRRRGTERDNITFDKFKEQEELEKSGSDPNSQQLKRVALMADYEINNSGSLAKLYAKIEEILKKESFEDKN